jgi:hypothetical protein
LLRDNVARVLVVLCAAVLFAGASSASERSVRVAERAVLFATIHARCDACAWDVEGREAATVVITLDGRYSQHLPLVRGPSGDYEVLVGSVEPGRHVVRAQIDRDRSAPELRSRRAASVWIREVTAVLKGEPTYDAVSLAPFVYARPNTLGRFTDVPVFMWYEQEPTGRGTRYRYSVIFTNEDGGTPADRLMATWGRTTDIEYVYSVEVDGAGTILADDYQGPRHEVLPFRGTREGRHPLLWVTTDNNMVQDTGTTGVRYAPAPVAFPLSGVSREAVMDANPWLYAIAAKELAREGKIAADAPPGTGKIPDPRRFVYLEGCGVVGGAAALAFEIEVGETWVASDRGMPEYRVVRDGCFRVATPLPPSIPTPDVRRLRIRAHPRKTDDVAREGSKTVTVGINSVFLLDDDYRPGPSILRKQAPAIVDVGGAPYEIALP